MGLYRAGFEVTGYDTKPQPRYPFEFRMGNALDADLSGFDFVWASPPCQRYTRAQNAAKNSNSHPDLIPTFREKLITWGGPYIIENVVGAPLIDPVLICGLALGLKVKRHRLFESNLFLFGTTCPSHDQDYYIIFGHEVRSRSGERKNRISDGRTAMGINWMNRGELSEAIPPAYSEFLGRQVIALLLNNPKTPPRNAVTERTHERET